MTLVIFLLKSTSYDSFSPSPLVLRPTATYAAAQHPVLVHPLKQRPTFSYASLKTGTAKLFILILDAGLLSEL